MSKLKKIKFLFVISCVFTYPVQILSSAEVISYGINEEPVLKKSRVETDNIVKRLKILLPEQIKTLGEVEKSCKQLLKNRIEQRKEKKNEELYNFDKESLRYSVLVVSINQLFQDMKSVLSCLNGSDKDDRNIGTLAAPAITEQLIKIKGMSETFLQKDIYDQLAELKDNLENITNGIPNPELKIIDEKEDLED
ncbi:MAG: hypothetical protein HEEMFOPI_00776 [Holosporales bacterium]